MFRHFERIGAGEGWRRRREVGAGGAGVPAWPAARVGPTGHVVATDLDTSWLPDATAERSAPTSKKARQVTRQLRNHGALRLSGHELPDVLLGHGLQPVSHPVAHGRLRRRPAPSRARGAGPVVALPVRAAV
ncbi:hypothetical protein ACQEVS_09500 [Streptomyces sp. CA-181903]|uniref:hypothetical protein n=1 Tax=Streptomyces sp. CA-181903 TaxID=3240055 RepID=UPI003D8A177C